MVRRHGWLAGLYIALEGLAILAFGLLFLFFIRRMFPAAMLPADPMRFFTGFITMILVVAGCQALFGAVLALVLWKRGRKN